MSSYSRYLSLLLKVNQIPFSVVTSKFVLEKTKGTSVFSLLTISKLSKTWNSKVFISSNANLEPLKRSLLTETYQYIQ